MNVSKLLKAYSRLLGLKENIPTPQQSVNQRFPNEYNQLVDVIADTSGEDLSEFKVPDDQIKSRVTSSSPSHGVHYSREKYCDGNFLLSKVDGLIHYVEMAYLKKVKI